jgi:hypothetical protein
MSRRETVARRAFVGLVASAAAVWTWRVMQAVLSWP